MRLKDALAGFASCFEERHDIEYHRGRCVFDLFEELDFYESLPGVRDALVTSDPTGAMQRLYSLCDLHGRAVASGVFDEITPQVVAQISEALGDLRTNNRAD